MNLDRVITCDGYVEFHFSGPVDATSILASLLDVHTRCTKDGLDAAIVDVSATTGTLDTLTRIELARAIAAEWTRTLALAMVVSEEQHMDQRPAQLAAQNRGMRAREFTDHASAVAWIRSTLP